MTSEPYRSTDDTRALLDGYREFRLSEDASPRAIRHRYRLLAKKWHPDKHVDRPESLALAKEKMRAINASYRLIKDAPLRGRGSGATRAPERARPIHRWSDPEPEWERACPNCQATLLVRGDRYAHCHRCGVGFFPTIEGRCEDRMPLTWTHKGAVIVFSVFMALDEGLDPVIAAIAAGLLTFALVAWDRVAGDS